MEQEPAAIVVYEAGSCGKSPGRGGINALQRSSASASAAKPACRIRVASAGSMQVSALHSKAAQGCAV